MRSACFSGWASAVALFLVEKPGLCREPSKREIDSLAPDFSPPSLVILIGFAFAPAKSSAGGNTADVVDEAASLYCLCLMGRLGGSSAAL